LTIRIFIDRSEIMQCRRRKERKRNRKPYRLTDLLLWVCQRHFELLLLLEMDVNCDPAHPRSSYDLIWITLEWRNSFRFYCCH
jgi:hypothetical protein